MKIEWPNNEFFLSDGTPLRVTGASGVHVRCLEGTVWITTGGQADDIFLPANQSHRIDSRALTLIEGVGTARIRLECPADRRFMPAWPTCAPSGLQKLFRETTALLSRTGRVASERDSHA